MNEQAIRPTKKQRELLSYIEAFIAQYGYSPSYREIMNGLNYTSVATVSLHVTSLIRRGHLRKRDRSARSLEVVTGSGTDLAGPNSEQQSRPGVAGHQEQPVGEQWLVGRVEQLFGEVERSDHSSAAALDELAALVVSLRVLGLAAAERQFASRLHELTARTD